MFNGSTPKVTLDPSGTPFWWGGEGCRQVPVSTWGRQRGTDKCAKTLWERGTAFSGGKQEKQFEVRFSLHDP